MIKKVGYHRQIFGENVMEEDKILYPDEKRGKQLTEREYEVLKFVVMGKTNAEIAQAMHISVHTAKAHVCSILQKMSVDDRVQAAVKAVRESLV